MVRAPDQRREPEGRHQREPTGGGRAAEFVCRHMKQRQLAEDVEEPVLKMRAGERADVQMLEAVGDLIKL